MPRNSARLTPLLVSLAAALGLAGLAAHAAPRAYVASDGNDARGRCTLAAPCRTFQAAHDVVDPGGEVVAIDTADYGPVAITKSVSILGGPGFVASIDATGTGVQVQAPGASVLLRHLDIRGAGGKRGIEVLQGAALGVEHCVVSNMTVEGLRVAAAADVRIVASTFRANGAQGALLDGAAAAYIAGSQFLGNGEAGLRVESTAGNFLKASVNDSVASGNGTHGFVLRGVLGTSWMTLNRVTAANNLGSGIRHENVSSFSMSTMTLGSSAATGNAVGLANVISQFTTIPLLESLGNNLVRGNGTDVLGPVATFGGI